MAASQLSFFALLSPLLPTKHAPELARHPEICDYDQAQADQYKNEGRHSEFAAEPPNPFQQQAKRREGQKKGAQEAKFVSARDVAHVVRKKVKSLVQRLPEEHRQRYDEQRTEQPGDSRENTIV
jgi:hypothetical protein